MACHEFYGDEVNVNVSSEISSLHSKIEWQTDKSCIYPVSHCHHYMNSSYTSYLMPCIRLYPRDGVLEWMREEEGRLFHWCEANLFMYSSSRCNFFLFLNFFLMFQYVMNAYFHNQQGLWHTNITSIIFIMFLLFLFSFNFSLSTFFCFLPTQ